MVKGNVSRLRLDWFDGFCEKLAPGNVLAH